MSKYFVTAIGTDNGKTVASAVLCKYLKADYWKPVQSGEPGDSDWMGKYAPDVKIHPEAYRLSIPASPHYSAQKDGVEIKWKELQLPDSGSRPLIVEGAGGLMVPLTREYLISDLIRHLDIPIILVVNFYLGSINHTLLTLDYLKNSDLKVKGVLFNGIQNSSSREVIESFCPFDILGEIPDISPFTVENIDKTVNEIELKL